MMKLTQFDACFPEDTIRQMMVAPVTYEALLQGWREKYFATLSAEQCKNILLGKDKYLDSLYGFMKSPGGIGKALKTNPKIAALNVKVVQSPAPGKGTQFFLEQIEGKLDPKQKNIPGWVRDVFKTAQTCAITKLPLVANDGEIDHRAGIEVIGGYSFDDVPTKKPENAERLANAKFQVLSRSANTKKRDTCAKCIRSGERPGGLEYEDGKYHTIKFWYAGDKTYNASLGEEACVGCGLFNPVAWREARRA